jgi:hypothetical protein
VTVADGLSSGDLLLAVEPEDVTAGGVGFLVIAGLAVGTFFLLRSMNKQLKKVDFDEAPEEPAEAADRADGEGSDSAGPDPVDESEEGPRSPDR